ncbi:MAG: hypothetical protein QME75_15185 [Deltaproteobacteria bacterium]|nr:hypothetical protein [Deltaproteobacteria bacterium]
MPKTVRLKTLEVFRQYVHLTWAAILLIVLIAAAFCFGCGRYAPVPAVWDPQAYRQITVEDLRAPGPAGLADGDKVKVPAYFWEFIVHDPAMVRNYLTMLRHPLAWPRLEWFAIYGTPNMQAYFDRVVMDKEQRRLYKLNRLDHIMIYGELTPMAGGLLYLRMHRLQKLEEG